VTLRALVVDDEPIARRRLRTLLKAEPAIEVIGECENGEEAVTSVRKLDPDLVFLDVQMPGLDGFEVIEALGPTACPAVIFVTAYDRYALDAFEVHAVDYLLKPFDRARLHDAVTRALALAPSRKQRLSALVADIGATRPVRRLVVRTRGRIYFVRADEIDWIEATGHYLTLHTGHESHMVRETMAGLEARLDPEHFLRIHRSTIVNVDRIKELQPTFHGEYLVTLLGGTRLQCSRSYAGRLDGLLRS